MNALFKFCLSILTGTILFVDCALAQASDSNNSELSAPLYGVENFVDELREISANFSLTIPAFEPIQKVEEIVSHFQKGPDQVLRKDFRTAMNAIADKKFALAGRALESLIFSAHTRGYYSLPDFSHELLRKAQEFADDNKIYEARFLVKYATLLSPDEARVMFAASSFYHVVGVKEALVFLYKALVGISTQPVFLGMLVANLVLLVLIALTLLLFVAAVVQVLCFSGRIYKFLSQRLPRRTRYILSPLALLLVLIAPLYFGILAATGVWSLVFLCVLATEEQRSTRKLFAILTGICCALWGVAFPYVTLVGYNLKLESTQVFEDINRSGFSPRGEKYVNERLLKTPDDIVHLFSLGQIFKMKSFSQSAQEQFETVKRLSGGGTLISMSSEANLGVIEYERGEYAKALEIFRATKAKGLGSFELYYNMAISSLMLLDTQGHKKYHELAKDTDPERLLRVTSGKNTTPRALLIPAPSSLTYSLMLRPIEITNPRHAEEIAKGEQAVFSMLVKGSNAELIFGFGLLIVIASLLVPKFFARRIQRVEIQDIDLDGADSRLPQTIPFAGANPVYGVLAFCVPLIFLILGGVFPLAYYGDFSSSVSFETEFLVLALFLFVASYFVSEKLSALEEVKNGR